MSQVALLLDQGGKLVQFGTLNTRDDQPFIYRNGLPLGMCYLPFSYGLVRYVELRFDKVECRLVMNEQDLGLGDDLDEFIEQRLVSTLPAGLAQFASRPTRTVVRDPASLQIHLFLRQTYYVVSDSAQLIALSSLPEVKLLDRPKPISL